MKPGLFAGALLALWAGPALSQDLTAPALPTDDTPPPRVTRKPKPRPGAATPTAPAEAKPAAAWLDDPGAAPKPATQPAATAVPEAEPRTEPVAAVPAAQPAAPDAQAPAARRWLDDPQEPRPALDPMPPAPADIDGNGRTMEQRRQAMQEYFRAMCKQAERAYDKKDYERAAAIARNVLTADPRHPVAIEILRKAHQKLANADAEVTRAAAERREHDALLEAEEHSVRPPVRVPEARPRFPLRDDDPGTERRKTMEERLGQRVTVDFMKADLEWVLNTLFILTGVNIIADPAALEGKTLTLHVEELPLREVLNFIVRNNEGIQYSVTEDAIWITATSSSDLKKLMFPKVYPLHHGLVQTKEPSGGGRSGRGGGGGGGNQGGGRGGQGGGQQGGGQGGGQGAAGERTYLESVLKHLKDTKDPQTFPEGSEYFIDLQSNNLLVFSTPAGHAKVKELLDVFDQPAIQVLIKARFLEVSTEDNKALGVNLDSVATRLTATDDSGNPATGATIRDPFRAFALAANTQTNLPGTLGQGLLFSITGRRTDPQFGITVNALLNNRNTRILSEPQILAINNKPAIIDVIRRFSYITDYREITTTTTANDSPATQNIAALVPEFDEEELGFTLVATPSVGRDMKTINLHLEPIIDSLGEGQQFTDFSDFSVISGDELAQQSIKQPIIDETSLETDVVLEDNGYVILGGLIRNRYETVERKIPGLHRMPYLGHLFKSKSTAKTTSNLVIIVEAQIISARGRTYHTEPVPDDVDIREGGHPRAPGQTVPLVRPKPVTRALGLPDEVPAEPEAPAPREEGRRNEPADQRQRASASREAGTWAVASEEGPREEAPATAQPAAREKRPNDTASARASVVDPDAP
ncbi:MAG: hypothetical protein HS116_04975 [Planctomycetes bacterium]|nr:hypothetical protein [Planctomycetota bacterium]